MGVYGFIFTYVIDLSNKQLEKLVQWKKNGVTFSGFYIDFTL